MKIKELVNKIDNDPTKFFNTNYMGDQFEVLKELKSFINRIKIPPGYRILDALRDKEKDDN